MPGTDFSVDTTGLTDVMSRISSLPKETQEQILADVANYGIDKAFSEYPPRVTHGANNPYQWTSRKQQQAFFASDGFGRGIPTKRTGELGKSWNFVINDSDVSFVNQANYAQFVVGENIQRGHVADGWKDITKKWIGALTFRSSTFRQVVQNAVRKAIGKLRLG